MNKALLDANALIAAFDQSHADHPRARAFFERLTRFCTSPQTQGAFLRFFTRPWTDSAGQRREPRMITGQAMSHLNALLALPKHQFIPDDLFGTVRVLIRRCPITREQGPANDGGCLPLARNCTIE